MDLKIKLGKEQLPQIEESNIDITTKQILAKLQFEKWHKPLDDFFDQFGREWFVGLIMTGH